MWQRRVWVMLVTVLLFGLPVFLLPDKLKEEDKWSELYNRTLGATTYKENIKPYVDMALGGTLRLFMQKVRNDSYFIDKEETSLFVTATLPNGSTVEQMNSLVQRMESYISQFSEVRQFQTSIESAYRASISIQFTKESQYSSFPFLLKSKLISRALELGGGSWSVVGLGDGFNNSVRESAGSSRVQLFGFNYDELVEQANKFKERLLSHRRIKDVIISSEFSYFKDDYMEFSYNVDKLQLAQLAIQPTDMITSVNSLFRRSTGAGQIPGKYGMEQIVLNSRQSKEYDVWSLNHLLNKTGDRAFKLSGLTTTEKTQTPQKIAKDRQQYRLCLQYEYIGSVEQSRRVLEQNIKEFELELPTGYTIEDQNRYGAWGGDGGKNSYGQLWMLMQILIIIYFACSILFNSLKQPFSILFVIPIAFIGIFLTFYLFELNFDQGGLASFVLICGIAINANIYILNEYNNVRAAHGKITPAKAYIKAWNAKIFPIFLTIVSTILGFIPFMVGNREAFWFPLAVGTIGGLVMSLVGAFCFLPLFMGVGKAK
jgi:multidrug efflux pump subunit AcrB